MTRRRADTFALILRQRHALADLLESLSDAEWEAPSLCAGWSVGDVAAHCIQSHVASPWRLAGEFLTAGFRLDARNERWVKTRRGRSKPTVLAEYRATADRMRIPASEAPYALVEAVVHGYDIARPLHKHLPVPPEALVLVTETCCNTGLFLHSKQRATGLDLHAADIPWSKGRGPRITGPLASIILAINSRPTALTDLSGPGLPILRSRLLPPGTV
ncbi:uncharacterized protein (TIGR03083 family) [Nocardia tenerifensis]|uniref:Uncharacterized protein (TIGR03083 family) n=1 Tax=Nocardia tenerifensis TaxID=228006 RepID=A0A318K9R6_9NOCA|nr:maleylpyruvate isomerase family mycothiol-dependent enzyme [Nocardia tenerifensis]PXX70826.1 uncharacterized protein (TIGR03083 family) [Nocardia tenerifensis]